MTDATYESILYGVIGVVGVLVAMAFAYWYGLSHLTVLVR